MINKVTTGLTTNENEQCLLSLRASRIAKCLNTIDLAFRLNLLLQNCTKNNN
jgi:hypothetical protein